MVEQNIGGGAGGGFYLNVPASADATFTGCTFRQNTCSFSQCGESVYALSGNGQLRFVNTEMVENSYGSDSFVYSVASITTYLQNSVICPYNNPATSYSVRGTGSLPVTIDSNSQATNFLAASASCSVGGGLENCDCRKVIYVDTSNAGCSAYCTNGDCMCQNLGQASGAVQLNDDVQIGPNCSPGEGTEFYVDDPDRMPRRIGSSSGAIRQLTCLSGMMQAAIFITFGSEVKIIK